MMWLIQDISLGWNIPDWGYFLIDQNPVFLSVLLSLSRH